MNVLIVHAHPEPTSFNGAMTRKAVETLEGWGHEVVVSDLWAEGFEAVGGRHDFVGMADPERFDYQVEQAHATEHGTFSEDLRREQARLSACDALILQYPLWWFGPPAVLKGWFDRVLAYKWSYDMQNRFANGRFRGRRGLISVTTGGTRERFSDSGLYGDIDYVLRPIQKGVIEYVGMEALEPFVAYAAPRVTDEERQEMLEAYVARLEELVAPPADASEPCAANASQP